MAELACSSHASCRWNEVFAANVREYLTPGAYLHIPVEQQSNFSRRVRYFILESTRLHSMGWPFVLQGQNRWVTDTSNLQPGRGGTRVCAIPHHQDTPKLPRVFSLCLVIWYCAVAVRERAIPNHRNTGGKIARYLLMISS